MVGNHVAHPTWLTIIIFSNVGWAKSFSCPPSSFKKWWATTLPTLHG
ncbi:MAG: hypothetical protein KAI83_14930 [Thiomargarita sp.]|nr:hypothetical protein [Thiomargarita sp.]